MVTLKQLFLETKQILELSGIESAEFDAMQIIGKYTGFDRGALLYYGENPIRDEIAGKVIADIEQRSTGVPLQYLLGIWEFMSLDFKVGPGVLIPRQDTETLCELVIARLCALSEGKLLDLCTGSGCVAISALYYARNAGADALDISADALEYARANARINQVEERIRFFTGDIRQAPAAELAAERYDVICANPPYIRSGDLRALQKELDYEPEGALDGGEDGLDCYRAIAVHWIGLLKEDGMLLLEVGVGQDEPVSQILEDAGFHDVMALKDLTGINRVICAAGLQKRA